MKADRAVLLLIEKEDGIQTDGKKGGGGGGDQRVRHTVNGALQLRETG